MTHEKKFYWLKLGDDFLGDKIIKKLRKSERGDTFIVIYLKILLTAIKSGGVIEWIHLEDSFAEELALELDEDEEDVSATLDFLFSVNLVQTEDNISFYFPDAMIFTGSECASANRVRECRERKKTQPCNTDEAAVPQSCNSETLHCNTGEASVPQSCNSETLHCNTGAAAVQQKCNTEIEIEKEIEKEQEIETEIEKEQEKESETEREIDIAPGAKKEKLSRRKYGEYKNALLSDEDVRDKGEPSLPPTHKLLQSGQQNRLP